MLEHHIQKNIVYSLAHAERLRFAELKPDGLENKLFDYHLKIVVRDGYVAKSGDGSYSLTAEGRMMWLRASKNEQWFAETAYSVLFMIIRRKSDGAWLLARRKTHPLFDMVGFIHGAPVYTEDIADTASSVVKAKTGLEGKFSYLGSGYLRIFNRDQLESYTHFNLLVCEDAPDADLSEDDTAAYLWVDQTKLSEQNLIPNMQTLIDLYTRGEQFFVEKTINY